METEEIVVDYRAIYPVHPESRLAAMAAEVAAAQQAYEAEGSRVAGLRAERAELDTWIEALDLDTSPAEIAAKQARHLALTKVIARAEPILAHMQAKHQRLLEAYEPLDRSYEVTVRRLFRLGDSTDPSTRKKSLLDIERGTRSARAWLDYYAGALTEVASEQER